MVKQRLASSARRPLRPQSVFTLSRDIESLTKIWWGNEQELGTEKKSLRPKAMRLLFPNGCFTLSPLRRNDIRALHAFARIEPLSMDVSNTAPSSPCWTAVYFVSHAQCPCRSRLWVTVYAQGFAAWFHQPQ